jgi:tetratricopeptide (TPR) repeat protein
LHPLASGDEIEQNLVSRETGEKVFGREETVMKLPVLSMALVLLGGSALAFAQDLESSFQSLKDAEAKNDAALVKKLSAETSALAKAAIAEPAPAAEEDKAGWTNRVTYAHEVESYTEYVLYAVAVKSQPATMVDLLAALEQANPKSKYLDQGYAYYIYALTQTGATAKIPAIAEKALVNFPDNIDLLIFMTEHGKSQAYANRLVAAVTKQAKPPEGVSAADWEKKRNAALGEGYYVSGTASFAKSQWAAADKNLRAALPFIKGNDASTGEALFELGVANYQLGKMTNSKAKVLEGAKFSDQCAAIPGPRVDQAWKNSAIMKKEGAAMR